MRNWKKKKTFNFKLMVNFNVVVQNILSEIRFISQEKMKILLELCQVGESKKVGDAPDGVPIHHRA